MSAHTLPNGNPDDCHLGPWAHGCEVVGDVKVDKISRSRFSRVATREARTGYACKVPNPTGGPTWWRELMDSDRMPHGTTLYRMV